MCRLSWNLGASSSWNPQGLSRPVMGLLYLYFNNGCTIASQCYVKRILPVLMNVQLPGTSGTQYAFKWFNSIWHCFPNILTLELHRIHQRTQHKARYFNVRDNTDWCRMVPWRLCSLKVRTKDVSLPRRLPTRSLMATCDWMPFIPTRDVTTPRRIVQLNLMSNVT